MDLSRREFLTGATAFALLRDSFAAERDGMMPAISVNSILITTKVTATGTGNTADRLLIPVRLCRMRLMGIHKR